MIFTKAWEWLQYCLEWFFPPALLADPFVSLLVNAIMFIFGFWFLGLIIFKPIVYLLNMITSFLKR